MKMLDSIRSYPVEMEVLMGDLSGDIIPYGSIWGIE